MEEKKRIISLDILRGIAILAMVFLHNAAFHYPNIDELLEADPLPTIIVVFGFLILWAGLFGFISGSAHGYIITRRILNSDSGTSKNSRKKGDEPVGDTKLSTDKITNKPQKIGQKKNFPPKRIIRHALFSFLIIFIFHWIWTVVTGNSIMTEDPNDPDLRTSLIIGLIYYGEIPRIHPEIYFFASSLWMIAVNVLVVGIALYYLYKKYGMENPMPVYKWLLGLSLVVFLLTPILRGFMFPVMMDLIEKGGVESIGALPLALLVNDPNPAFPFLGYGLVGAMVGIMIAQKESPKKIRLFLLIFGLIIGSAGLIGYMYSGGLIVAGRGDIWGQDAFYFSSLSYLILGIFCLIYIILLSFFDFCSVAKRKKRKNMFNSLKRPGHHSLTIFIFEGIVAISLRRLIEVFAPAWNSSIVNCIIFAVSNVFLWVVVLYYWEKVDFKYSLEYFIKELQKLMKKSPKKN